MISYCKGNTFEGHTMIPVLDTFAQTYNVETPVVIADAAMISRDNIAKLYERKLSYIVGARLGNVSPKVVKEITSTLEKKDINTDQKSLKSNSPLFPLMGIVGVMMMK
jgi:transposase